MEPNKKLEALHEKGFWNATLKEVQEAVTGNNVAYFRLKQGLKPGEKFSFAFADGEGVSVLEEAIDHVSNRDDGELVAAGGDIGEALKAITAKIMGPAKSETFLQQAMDSASQLAELYPPDTFHGLTEEDQKQLMAALTHHANQNGLIDLSTNDEMLSSALDAHLKGKPFTGHTLESHSVHEPGSEIQMKNLAKTVQELRDSLPDGELELHIERGDDIGHAFMNLSVAGDAQVEIIHRLLVTVGILGEDDIKGTTHG